MSKSYLSFTSPPPLIPPSPPLLPPLLLLRPPPPLIGFKWQLGRLPYNLKTLMSKICQTFPVTDKQTNRPTYLLLEAQSSKFKSSFPDLIAQRISPFYIRASQKNTFCEKSKCTWCFPMMCININIHKIFLGPNPPFLGCSGILNL